MSDSERLGQWLLIVYRPTSQIMLIQNYPIPLPYLADLSICRPSSYSEVTLTLKVTAILEITASWLPSVADL